MAKGDVGSQNYMNQALASQPKNMGNYMQGPVMAPDPTGIGPSFPQMLIQRALQNQLMMQQLGGPAGMQNPGMATRSFGTPGYQTGAPPMGIKSMGGGRPRPSSMGGQRGAKTT